MTEPASAQETLRATVEADRLRIAKGERPVYHVRRAASIDGSIDVTIHELPLIRLFVPDDAGVIDGARLLIARTLDVDPGTFEVWSYWTVAVK
jgi:hypothetical protein